jgi:hypothetical protein
LENSWVSLDAGKYFPVERSNLRDVVELVRLAGVRF